MISREQGPYIHGGNPWHPWNKQSSFTFVEYKRTMKTHKTLGRPALRTGASEQLAWRTALNKTRMSCGMTFSRWKWPKWKLPLKHMNIKEENSTVRHGGCAWNASTVQLEVRGCRVQGYPQLDSKFKASLGLENKQINIFFKTVSHVLWHMPMSQGGH